MRAALSAALLLVAGAANPAPAAAPQPTLPMAQLAVGMGERLLIVAPHPDDELLCCAGLMQRALASGARVGVLWITSGDAFELDAALIERTLLPGHRAMLKLAEDRMAEAVAVAGRLGIAPEDRWFLGYPDRGIRRLMTDYFARPYTSRYTGVSAVPYASALSPNAAYEGRWLERDVLAVLDRFRPTLVLAPAPLDRHRDHAAVGDLMLRVLSGREQWASVRYWVVHAGADWPPPRHYAPEVPLEPPLRLQNLGWESWPLSTAERDEKLVLLRLYRSQWRIMRSFLAAFVRNNEIFATQSYPPEVAPPPATVLRRP